MSELSKKMRKECQEIFIKNPRRRAVIITRKTLEGNKKFWVRKKDLVKNK